MMENEFNKWDFVDYDGIKKDSKLSFYYLI